MRYAKKSVKRALLGSGVIMWSLLVTPISSYTVPRFPHSTILSSEDIEEAVERGRVSFPDRLTLESRLLRARSSHAEVEIQ